MELQSVWKFFHILLFVYWLGGDLGVFYASRYRNNPSVDVRTRQLIAKICGAVDMAPRTTLVLMLPVGLSLADSVGISVIGTGWLTVIWIACLAWLTLVWLLHLKKDNPAVRRFSNVDLLIRATVIVVLVVAAIASFAGGSPFTENWLALKVLLYAGTISCGIGIRMAARPYGPAFQRLVADGSTPKVEDVMRQSARRARRWVKALWVLLLVAAWIGIDKPTL